MSGDHIVTARVSAAQVLADANAILATDAVARAQAKAHEVARKAAVAAERAAWDEKQKDERHKKEIERAVRGSEDGRRRQDDFDARKKRFDEMRERMIEERRPWLGFSKKTRKQAELEVDDLLWVERSTLFVGPSTDGFIFHGESNPPLASVFVPSPALQIFRATSPPSSIGEITALRDLAARLVSEGGCPTLRISAQQAALLVADYSNSYPEYEVQLPGRRGQ